jgi:hypothetical protein
MDSDSTFSSVFGSRAESLAKMMDANGGQQEFWTPKDLEAILDHQLSTAVDVDLAAMAQSSAEHVRALAAAAVPPIKTFRDLFHHPRPPVELLELTKRFAKRCRNSPDSPLPDEVATVLYFLSIVVAMRNCRTRISGMDEQALRHGLDWALGQPWLDKDAQRLLREGNTTLTEPRDGA